MKYIDRDSIEAEYYNSTDTIPKNDIKYLTEDQYVKQRALYAPYINRDYKPTITILDIVLVDVKRYGEPNGRWIGEKYQSVYDILKGQIKKSVLFDQMYEDIIQRYPEFRMRLNTDANHFIDKYVEYFGYLSELEIHCFRINFNAFVA